MELDAHALEVLLHDAAVSQLKLKLVAGAPGVEIASVTGGLRLLKRSLGVSFNATAAPQPTPAASNASSLAAASLAAASLVAAGQLAASNVFAATPWSAALDVAPERVSNMKATPSVAVLASHAVLDEATEKVASEAEGAAAAAIAAAMAAADAAANLVNPASGLPQLANPGFANGSEDGFANASQQKARAAVGDAVRNAVHAATAKAAVSHSLHRAPVFVAGEEVRVLGVKKRLDRLVAQGLKVELHGSGADQRLECFEEGARGVVVVVKQDPRVKQLQLEGPLCAVYFRVRQALYDSLTMV